MSSSAGAAVPVTYRNYSGRTGVLPATMVSLCIGALLIARAINILK
jgi:hypothetical protein